jgi:heme exporter protein A
LSDPENILNAAISSKTLVLEGLSFQRNEDFLFSNINIDLMSGDILQVLGQNGSGKTTLLRLISTALNPYSGKIMWQGKNIDKNREDYLENILYIGHQPSLKRLLSAKENLTWWRRLNKTNSKDNSEALRQVGLIKYADEPCFLLSAGQLRRAALARLYISNAKIWILDEPFTSIDKDFSSKLISLFTKHLESKGIVILTTHQDLKVKNMKFLSMSARSKINNE